MAGYNGRQLEVDWDSVTLVGMRSKTVTRNNDLVDVTTDDDSGWRTLLANPGLKSVEVQISGITSDKVLIAEFYDASATGETLEITLPINTDVESGTFMLSNIETTAEHDGAIEFSATFMNSGEVTWTPGA